MKAMLLAALVVMVAFDLLARFDRAPEMLIDGSIERNE